MTGKDDTGDPRIDGAICCFTGDGIGSEELIHLPVDPGNGTGGYQTFVTTPDRLRAALNPSIPVDFDAVADKDGTT